MSLVTCYGISIAFGAEKLLADANLAIRSGERIGLLGRNGTGKSTLLALIMGTLQPDEGEIHYAPGISVAMLDQTPKLPADTTIFNAVADGLGEVGTCLKEYHQVIGSDELPQARKLERIELLQRQIEANDGWHLEQRVKKVLSRLSLSGDHLVATLSGGWQRRVSLARALVASPQVLLLDEPTNHLDIAAIKWLETQILNFQGAVLFVTHDRSFLQRVANRIIDLDRGQLRSWAGDYNDYLRRKADVLAQEARKDNAFDRKLAQEEVWIRQGIQARRTRNEGRVRALTKLRIERRQRQGLQENVKIHLDQSEASGKLVIEAQNVTFAYQEAMIARDFSTRIHRGDRVGLIGANGIGKTTLIRLLLGEQTPDRGQIRLGHNLQIAWFDQLRTQIDRRKTVIEAVGEGREIITIGGRDLHIISYLSNFLFAPSRAYAPVKSLSGGECARALLAKLFSKPANMLVLDEPTNDLDVETLELLEELLLNFQGTLILVSHDRQFMDNVVTSTLSLEGGGLIREFIGGYSDWERQQPKIQPGEIQTSTEHPSPDSTSILPVYAAKRQQRKKKPGYREQQELLQLPDRIEQLEERQKKLIAIISDNEYYRMDSKSITDTHNELNIISQELEDCYHRWEELES